MNAPACAARRVWPWVLGACATGGIFLALTFHGETPVRLAPPAPALGPASVAPSVAAAAPDWDERWQRWLRRLAAPGADAALAAEFEALVLADPGRALASARRERAPARRASLLQAIMLLWAETDPAAAAAAARALPDAERALGVAAVLAGASGRPEAAVRLAVEFCRDDPAFASEHGYALIAALGRTGEFRAAIRFALGEANAAADEDHNKWLRAAFAQWSAQNPAAALAAIQELPGAGARFEALEAIAASRGRTDPAGLAEALRQLPAGPDRSLALGQALRTWVNRDPKTAADWLDRLDPSPELDAGAAAVAAATQVHTVDRRPEVALSWAESIAGAELRSRTLVAVVRKWAAGDPAAARRYAETSPDLLPEDRATLLNLPPAP